MFKTRKSKLIVAAVTTVAAVGALAGTASAKVGPGSPTPWTNLYGCRTTNGTGALVNVHTQLGQTHCKRGEVLVAVNGAAPGTGPRGKTGARGATGAKGATGARGLQGIQGLRGLTGDTGAVGAQGPAGAVGATGPKGDAGAAGKDGQDGAQGPKGDKGDTGATGAPGKDGSNGQDGRGIASTKVDDNGDLQITYTDGSTSDAGHVVGQNGADGTNGTDGTNGSNGSDGATGATGATGAQGPAGPQGLPGTPGTDGSNGTNITNVVYTPAKEINGHGNGGYLTFSMSSGQPFTVYIPNSQ